MAPACQLCDSVGGGLRKGTMAIAHLFVWEKAVPYPHSHLDTRPFSSSLYATGAFQAATLVLELRGIEFVYLFFKGNCLELQMFLP